MKQQYRTSSPAPYKIGTITITEPEVITRQYETACNFDKIEIAPGTYPVWCTGCYAVKGRVSSPKIWAPCDGVIVENFYQKRLFSSVSNHHNDKVGRAATGRILFHATNIVTDPRFVPDPDLDLEALSENQFVIPK